VLQVQGRWREAAAGCDRLAGKRYLALGTAVQLPAQACLAELASLQGQAAQASATLATLARQAKGSGDGKTSAWLALLRAELAERQGDNGAAQMLYLQALGGDARQADVYALAAYADWLLARGREREVHALLAGRTDADALLLRLAIAWHRSKNPQAQGAIATLAERFAAAALRGDVSHRREQARFELELRGNPSAALAHAQANWAAQKEPADALILLRCAQAARQWQAAEPVWRLLRETGFQDARLDTATTASMPPA
jgi:hypothetical protein